MIITQDELENACRSLGLKPDVAVPARSPAWNRAEREWHRLTEAERLREMVEVEHVIRRHLRMPMVKVTPPRYPSRHEARP